MRSKFENPSLSSSNGTNDNTLWTHLCCCGPILGGMWRVFKCAQMDWKWDSSKNVRCYLCWPNQISWGDLRESGYLGVMLNWWWQILYNSPKGGKQGKRHLSELCWWTLLFFRNACYWNAFCDLVPSSKKCWHVNLSITSYIGFVMSTSEASKGINILR